MQDQELEFFSLMENEFIVEPSNLSVYPEKRRSFFENLNKPSKRAKRRSSSKMYFNTLDFAATKEVTN